MATTRDLCTLSARRGVERAKEPPPHPAEGQRGRLGSEVDECVGTCRATSEGWAPWLWDSPGGHQGRVAGLPVQWTLLALCPLYDGNRSHRNQEDRHALFERRGKRHSGRGHSCHPRSPRGLSLPNAGPLSFLLELRTSPVPRSHAVVCPVRGAWARGASQQLGSGVLPGGKAPRSCH